MTPCEPWLTHRKRSVRDYCFEDMLDIGISNTGVWGGFGAGAGFGVAPILLVLTHLRFIPSVHSGMDDDVGGCFNCNKYSAISNTEDSKARVARQVSYKFLSSKLKYKCKARYTHWIY